MVARRRTEAIAPVEPQDVRKPWVTPKVIVSEAVRTNKNHNTNEVTFGPNPSQIYGPS